MTLREDGGELVSSARLKMTVCRGRLSTKSTFQAKNFALLQPDTHNTCSQCLTRPTTTASIELDELSRETTAVAMGVPRNRAQKGSNKRHKRISRKQSW
jgi:hypothetical protein